MTADIGRRLWSVVAAAALLLGALVATPQASAASTDPNAPGQRSLAACMQSAETLSVLFLMDASGSLKGTDPDNLRFDGMRLALERLAGLSRPDQKPLIVDVAVSKFAGAYSPVTRVVDWTRVNDTESQDVIDRVIREARTNGQPDEGTNFEVALDGGLGDITDRADTNACRVVLWFTDGEFTDAPGGVPDATNRLCAEGGTVDKYREAGIAVVGLQLGVDQTALEPMSRGTGGVCGTSPLPEGWQPGLYMRATDESGLRRLFSQVLTGMEGCVSTDGRGALVDPGIGRLRIVLDAPSSLSSVRLDSPDGASMSAPTQGSFEQDGFRVTATTIGQTVTLDVHVPAGGGVGTWSVQPNVALTPDLIEFFACPDLRLSADPAANPLTAGAPGDVAVGVVDAHNTPVDVALFADAVIGATAIGVNDSVVKAIASRSGAAYSVRVEPSPTDARITLNAQVNLTTQSGIALPPLTLSTVLTPKLSKAFPLVSPLDRLLIPAAVKTNPTSASISLAGSPLGPTKVCFAPPKDVVVPRVEAGVVPQYASGCVDLAQGETKEITVTVTPTVATTGDGRAVIPLEMHSAPVAGAPSLSANVDLPVTWRFEDPLSKGALGLTIGLALLLSLLPLLAITLANRLSARYLVKGVVHAVIPVVVTRNGIRRTEPMPHAPADQLIDLMSLSPVPGLGSKPKREFRLPPVTLHAFAPWNVFRAPRFWGTVPDGMMILSTAGNGSSATEAPATPGLHTLGLLVVPAAEVKRDSASASGTLIVIVSDRGRDSAELDRSIRGGLGQDPLAALVDLAESTSPSSQQTSTHTTIADAIVLPKNTRRKRSRS